MAAANMVAVRARRVAGIGALLGGSPQAPDRLPARPCHHGLRRAGRGGTAAADLGRAPGDWEAWQVSARAAAGMSGEEWRAWRGSVGVEARPPARMAAR